MFLRLVLLLQMEAKKKTSHQLHLQRDGMREILVSNILYLLFFIDKYVKMIIIILLGKNKYIMANSSNYEVIRKPMAITKVLEAKQELIEIYNEKKREEDPIVITNITTKFKDEIVINERLKEYDIFLFDAYGVFWDGTRLIRATANDMANLVKAGKIVCVVSNTTELSEDAKKKYAKRGFREGEHYTEFVTSGDLMRVDIETGRLDKKIREEIEKEEKTDRKIKIFISGKPRKELFVGSNFEFVDNPQYADAVYLSVPQFTNKDKRAILEKHKEYEKYFVDTKGKGKHSIDGYVWDIRDIEGSEAVFEDIIERFKDKIIINANPDCVAQEGGYNVLRNGTLTKMCRERKMPIIEYGKPNKEIFDFALNKIKEQKKRLDIGSQKLEESKPKTIMFGDTRETDIQGAKSAEISSVLVSTGNEKRYAKKRRKKYGQRSGATFFLLRRKNTMPPEKMTERLEKEKMEVKTGVKSRSR